MKCPACKGAGELLICPHHRGDVEAKRVAAKALSKAGFSIRQIQRVLNYKSPRSVAAILETP